MGTPDQPAGHGRRAGASAKLQRMNARVDHLLEDVLRLAPEERSAVAAALIDSLEVADQASIPEAWRKELLRRRAALAAGQVSAVPWAEARARLAAQ
jgi:putative addiction module component (TIGR02574 family)